MYKLVTTAASKNSRCRYVARTINHMTKVTVAIIFFFLTNTLQAADSTAIVALKHQMAGMLAIDSELIAEALHEVDSGGRKPAFYVYDENLKKRVAYSSLLKPFHPTTDKQRRAYLKRRIEIYKADRQSYLRRIKELEVQLAAK
jgi:hypothetical protein